MCGEETRWLPAPANVGRGAMLAHALPRPLQRLVISQETRSARHAAARRPVAPGRGRRAGGHVHCRQVLLLQGLRHWRPRELPQARVYPEGTHIVIPWFERPIIYDVRTRPNLVESTSGSRDLQMVPTRGIGLRCGCTRGC